MRKYKTKVVDPDKIPPKEITKMTMGFLKGSKLYFIVGMIAAILMAVVDMINPQVISITVDYILGAADDEISGIAATIVERLGGIVYLREHLYYIAILIVVLAAFTVLFQYSNVVFNTKGAETLVKTMRDRLFAHISGLPFSWHMKNQTGDIIQRCTSDVDTVKTFVAAQLTALFRISVMLIMALIVMFSMNWELSIVAFVFMPLILFFSVKYRKRISNDFKICDESEAVLSNMVQENLTGVRVVRAFGRESYERERFSRQNEKHTGYWINLQRMFTIFWGSVDLVFAIQVMLIVIFGAIMCAKGKMSPGNYIAFISYNSMLMWPIRQLGYMISDLSKAGVSLERIYNIMSHPVEADKPDATTPDMRGDIRFENVSFNYEGYPQVLHDISFDIKAGSTVGIIGGTGAGKSTLMYLLGRLYDIPENSGRITVNGVDINDIKAQWLRSNIGIVLQEPFLFSRTIAENIGVAKENATLEDIRQAARVACFDDTVMSFADGYDTRVGERGVSLSGGQKQRAAISRLVLQNTPIMIFDDSLSAVDTETDSKIRHALLKEASDATLILISHRITTLMHADKIIVLDKGRIAEQGTHEELLANGGIYRQIYDIQSAGAEEVG